MFSMLNAQLKNSRSLKVTGTGSVIYPNPLQILNPYHKISSSQYIQSTVILKSIKSIFQFSINRRQKEKKKSPKKLQKLKKEYLSGDDEPTIFGCVVLCDLLEAVDLVIGGHRLMHKIPPISDLKIDRIKRIYEINKFLRRNPRTKNLKKTLFYI